MSVETDWERTENIKQKYFKIAASFWAGDDADYLGWMKSVFVGKDLDFLIERAEENIHLQKQLAAAKPVFSRRMLESEVKIMRKALTEISVTPITRGIGPVDRALQSVVLEARQALGDVNHNPSAYHPISHTTNIEEEME